MSDSPVLLVVCQQIDAAPDGNHAREVAGDHAAARRVEPDQHDGVGVRLRLFLGCLGLFVPDGNAA